QIDAVAEVLSERHQRRAPALDPLERRMLAPRQRIDGGTEAIASAPNLLDEAVPGKGGERAVDCRFALAEAGGEFLQRHAGGRGLPELAEQQGDKLRIGGDNRNVP